VKLAAVLVVLSIAGAWLQAGEARPEQKLAVVNVSFIFEKYSKVPDIQRTIDAKFKPSLDELKAREKSLSEKNKELEKFATDASASEDVFDKIQRLRKEMYIFERDQRVYNDNIAQAYTREMRNVLTDIRSVIRNVAQAGKYDLVLRSPDADDPDVVESNTSGPKNPAANDNKTTLQLIAPQSVEELVERFNRNPVLFGAKTTDITQDVLAKLNEEYARTGGSAAPKPK
jgi:Skp family chaperone for outer membrane proteins